MWQKLSGHIQPLAAVAEVESGPPVMLLTYIVHGETLKYTGVVSWCLRCMFIFSDSFQAALEMKNNEEVSKTKNYMLRLCFC